MKKWFLVFLLLSFSRFVSADSSLPQLMQKLQSKYDSLESLKANFTQSYTSKRFSEKMTEKGIVYFRKGGLMKWEYKTPEPKIFLSDGTYYYYYLIEDKQVVKAVADQGKDQHSPTLFLAGRGNFLKDFRAEWADPRPGGHLLKLTPLRPQPDFKYLVIDVDPVSGVILGLVVVDPYENRTEYRFESIQENPKLPTDFFIFHQPPDTEIVFQQGDAG
jgi:outer membrane lipoprotein carrier protein